MRDAITWDDVVRRMRAGEPLQDILDEKDAADRERFRSSLADLGPRGADALRGYDAAMRDHDSGATGARNCWHSISPAQRRTLLFLAAWAFEPNARGRVLVRSTRCDRYHDAVGTAPGVDTIAKAARLDTVRNLASRGLVAWDGTAHDPERRAVPSERGRFVVRHGAAGAPLAA